MQSKYGIIEAEDYLAMRYCFSSFFVLCFVLAAPIFFVLTFCRPLSSDNLLFCSHLFCQKTRFHFEWASECVCAHFCSNFVLFIHWVCFFLLLFLCVDYIILVHYTEHQWMNEYMNYNNNAEKSKTEANTKTKREQLTNS